ncbi:uncharacterized protein [Blastocystis hominis]|uniref:OCRE domain-containing protein n=1 Tax=Blastocystis hominis TaxID=12968 RepID=D8M501_BLAHO|nr:uncharacterized protein [Blastocystis hominis]CBK23140.2 unnamed protein product [Blastocystis hominis]|eukprot:XP_012897188.1 uncharacterized protein [Blastocystis hominis]
MQPPLQPSSSQVDSQTGPSVATPAQPSSSSSSSSAQPLKHDKGSSLFSNQKKLADGRPFPSDYRTNSLNFTFDAASGFFYEASSKFYYCSSADLYLDSVSSLYYTLKDHTLTPFTPPLPSTTAAPPPIPPPPEQPAIISAPSTFQFAPQPAAPAAPIALTIKFKTDLHEIIKPPPPPSQPASSSSSSSQHAAPDSKDSLDTLQLLPGQSVNWDLQPARSKAAKRKAPPKEPEKAPKKEPPSLGEMRRIAGRSRHGCPACFVRLNRGFNGRCAVDASKTTRSFNSTWRRASCIK